MAAVNDNEQPTLDAETLSRVAREVIARLGHVAATPSSQELGFPTSKTDRTATSIDDRVITAATIARLPSGTAELFIDASAVITPSATDEARVRQIAINRQTKPIGGVKPPKGSAQIIDFADPARAAAVAQQLARRAITSFNAKVILSDTPARDLYHQCTRHGEVAVMVGSIDEVQRFADELDATVWVLDMKRLNLIAAVNVAAHIARTGRTPR